MWIYFLCLYDHMTTSPEQNHINELHFHHCIFSDKLDLIQATSLLITVLKYFNPYSSPLLTSPLVAISPWISDSYEMNLSVVNFTNILHIAFVCKIFVYNYFMSAFCAKILAKKYKPKILNLECYAQKARIKCW